MTSFTVSDEWKNKQKWANCSRERLLETIESFAMAYHVTLMKLREKDKEIARLKKENEELAQTMGCILLTKCGGI